MRILVPSVYSFVALTTSHNLLAQDLIDLSAPHSGEFSLLRADAPYPFGHGVSIDGGEDLNEDGLSDLLVGLSGRAYVVFGQPHRPDSIDLATANPSSAKLLAQTARVTIVSPSFVGDVNGDGVDDIAMPGLLDRNTYILVFGPIEDDIPISGQINFDGINRVVFEGSILGGSTHAAGDINGDGIADLLLQGQAPLLMGARAHVVFGSRTPFRPVIDLDQLSSEAGVTIMAGGPYMSSARAMGSPGDLNGDGYDDIVFGKGSYDGVAVAIFGRPAFPSTYIALAAISGADGFVLRDAESGGLLGYSIGGRGDVNGDGLNDLLVGAPRILSDQIRVTGAGFLLLGQSSPFDPFVFNTAATGGPVITQFMGQQPHSWTSASNAIVPDVNGDSLDDMLISAYRLERNGNFSVGGAYLVFGSRDGFSDHIELADLDGQSGLLITGEREGGGIGRSLSTAGDFDGDGVNDIALTAVYYDGDNGSLAQEVYVVYGDAAPYSARPMVSMPTVLSSASNPPGISVQSLWAPVFVDGDGDDFAGGAIVSNESSELEGVWQVCQDLNGWSSVPLTVSDTNAVVLGADDAVRFLPSGTFEGVPGSLSVRLWDGRWRAPGQSIDISGAIGGLGGFAGDSQVLKTRASVSGFFVGDFEASPLPHSTCGGANNGASPRTTGSGAEDPS